MIMRIKFTSLCPKLNLRSLLSKGVHDIFICFVWSFCRGYFLKWCGFDISIYDSTQNSGHDKNTLCSRVDSSAAWKAQNLVVVCRSLVTTMIFTLLVTHSNDMKSNRSQPTRDDIGLPLLRKSISEPRLLTGVDHRFERQNHRHISSATPRILNANGPSSQRRSAVLKPAEESQPPQHDVPAVAADRSIDMINPLNFPVVMTKNFLRRRANTADIHAHSETLNADRKNGGLRVTNGKYGSPAGSGAEHSDRARGILNQREHGSSRNCGWQPFEDGHKMRNDVTLPGVSSWRKAEGSSVLAALPGNKSDLQRGRSSAASSCSWQTYPLSSRPFSTHRGSKYLRGKY